MNNKWKNLISLSQSWIGSLIIMGLVLLFLSTRNDASAAPLSQANFVTVQMFQLNGNGSNTNIPCSADNNNLREYGCTFIPNNANYAYPYETYSSPSVPFETDYLLDVVAQEMSPELYGSSAALEAQAIASRSLANYYINNPPEDGIPVDDPFNNSTKYQAFFPYRFEALNGNALVNNPSDPCASTNLNGYQQQVCAAIASREYIASASPPGNQFAAKALFAGDIFAQTADGTDDKPYLGSVLDPISVACDAQNEAVYQLGMSQKGANRWARGDQCSRDDVATVGDNPAGGPWSVKWASSEQILFHYYTDVNLLDNNGNRLSPFYRWNPLALTGLPEVLYPSQSSEVIIQVQNTSAANWDCNAPMSNMSVPVPFIINFELRARLIKRGYPSLWLPDSPSLCGLEKGQSQTVTFSVENIPQEWGTGPVTLRFDMRAIGSPTFWFSSPESDDVDGWPVYEVQRCLINCEVYIPHLSKFEYPRATD